jgi:hypothetical protein
MIALATGGAPKSIAHFDTRKIVTGATRRNAAVWPAFQMLLIEAINLGLPWHAFRLIKT